MRLRGRLLLLSVAVALPVAVMLTMAVNSMRRSDRRVALERVVVAQVTDVARGRCEAEPSVFLGSNGSRPKPDEVTLANPDVPPPRGRLEPQPFEFYVYDEEFIPQHPLAPRFPEEYRRRLRASSAPVHGTFDSPEGTGIQVAVLTEWLGGPCRYFMGRLRPIGHETTETMATFGVLWVVVSGIGLIVGGPNVLRTRQLSAAV